MVVAKVIAKAGFLSVALLNTIALALGLSLFNTMTTQNRAYAGPENIVYDDMEKNTETCRREYPHWDHPDFMDVWFGRDNDNNPICLAQNERHSQPIVLCWPQGAVVSVFTHEVKCYCEESR